VQAERHVERMGALDPARLVLAVGRADERRDAEARRARADERREARPHVVVEEALDVTGGDRCAHGSVR
jgi:hypothetical protein